MTAPTGAAPDDAGLAVVELLFNLLSLARRGFRPAALSRALKRRGLHYGAAHACAPLLKVKISFWINLCRSAGLLDEADAPRPTLLAEDWLGRPLRRQMTLLLHAWMPSPCRPRDRRARARLVDDLRRGQPLTHAEQKALPGLQFLGLADGEALSDLGRAVLALPGAPEAAEPPDARPGPEKWRVANGALLAPYPPDWGALWLLEAYMDPAAPGVYALDRPALRKAVQRAAQPGLGLARWLEMLDFQLESGIPPEVAAKIEAAAPLRVRQGVVLEFGDAAELVRLRKLRSLRQDLNGLLSPRHVLLPPERAPLVCARLLRRGLLAEWQAAKWADAENLQPADPVPGSPHAPRPALTKAEQVYLLALVWVAEGLERPFGAPLGLETRLRNGMPAALQRSAARRALDVLQQIFPESPWRPEEAAPPSPPPALRAALRQAIEAQDSLTVVYRKLGSEAGETRQILPLLLEARNGRWYLLAYCYTRRANRVFRVDRLALADAAGDGAVRTR